MRDRLYELEQIAHDKSENVPKNVPSAEGSREIPRQFSEQTPRETKEVARSKMSGGKKSRDVEEGIRTEKGETSETKFFFEVDRIRQSLLKLKKNVDDISELHSKTLTAISEKEEQHLRQQLDSLMAETSSLAIEIRNGLKDMEEDNKEFEGTDDYRIRLNQHGALTRKFITTMKGYQESQNKYKEKYLKRMERQYRIINPEAKDEEIQRLLDSESGPVFAEQILASGQPEAKKKTLEEIQNRHRELLKLEKSISELYQLLLDMTILVESQGDIIGDIDKNVENAVQYTAEGYREMRKAVVYQRRARKKLVIIIICLIIIAAAIAIPLAIALKK